MTGAHRDYPMLASEAAEGTGGPPPQVASGRLAAARAPMWRTQIGPIWVSQVYTAEDPTAIRTAGVCASLETSADHAM
jgi:hypothetical protein